MRIYQMYKSDEFIIENNKLIAEFMGWKKDGDNESSCLAPAGFPYWSPYIKYSPVNLRDLKFYNSFDFLIPVLHKLKDLGAKWELKTDCENYSFNISISTDSNTVKVFSNSENANDTASFAFGDHIQYLIAETAYGAIIDYIKWHNDNYFK